MFLCVFQVSKFQRRPKMEIAPRAPELFSLHLWMSCRNARTRSKRYRIIQINKFFKMHILKVREMLVINKVPFHQIPRCGTYGSVHGLLQSSISSSPICPPTCSTHYHPPVLSPNILHLIPIGNLVLPFYNIPTAPFIYMPPFPAIHD